jgi:hypothetical protein
MATRLNRRHSQMVREKIQAVQLINRLQSEALGEIELTVGQRDSAKFLIHHAIGSPPQEVLAEHDGKIIIEIVPQGGAHVETDES